MREEIKVKTGDKFGHLTIINDSIDKINGDIYVMCRCDCGNIKRIRRRCLINGKTKSCGCEVIVRNKEVHTKHGMSHSKTYKSWLGMKQRCYNPNFADYHNYGGRGIKICDRWVHSFKNFLDDMGIMPDGDKITLERIDNNRGYYPDNCRWETLRNQQRNRRNNHRIDYNNESLTIVEWGEKLGIKPNTILTRIRRGWNIERAFQV